ncbi:MAG: type II toxin-antitoxin system VapC family toxin [Okeania sp. SIO2H7]|nr:type II toxin-antitoxin system VapC family toxin [Okeania sp. SIO2H7]
MIEENKNYKIYLDVCCLNRPFDEQKQSRIRIETEAIIEIVTRFESGDWELIGSTVLESEIEQTRSPTRKEQLRESLLMAKTKILVTQEITTRAIELSGLGFKPYDALHLACAENNADVFLTTDDRLLAKALTYRDNLRVAVYNPIMWFVEVTTS